MTESNLNSLDVILPTEEEVESVNSAGPYQNLARVDQFYFDLSKVSGFQYRVKSLKFLFAYENMFSEIEPNIEILTRAFKNLRESNKLKSFFEFSLAVGNYLNGTSARGGAFAFKLGRE